MTTISACIIAKNEEKNLLRCLKSITNLADEIILVDTGSNDNTINIAKKFNANIIEFPWNNNFSDARNKALEHATKDWILIIDCDEALDISQIRDIKNTLSQASNIGFSLKLVNIINNSPIEGEYLFRIFKNYSGFYFKGRINERIFNSSLEMDFKKNIMNLDYKLYNYGFDLDKKDLNKRCYRNLSIYSDYEISNTTCIHYFDIANEYFLLGNYSKAVTNYSKALYSCDDIFISSYITYVIIKTYYHAKKYNLGISVGECLSVKYNKIRDIYLIIALCYLKLDDIESYRENYKKYLMSFENIHKYYFDLIFIENERLIPEMFGFRLNNFVI